MDEPRWLVDEMLGRLCRYLRFLGYDAEYVRGQADPLIADRARREARRLVTRDRALARQVPGSVLLTRTDIEGQVAELRRQVPTLATSVRFIRCSLCNASLARVDARRLDPAQLAEAPPEVRAGTVALYRCSACHHLYWEGSHTRSIEAQLARWTSMDG